MNHQFKYNDIYNDKFKSEKRGLNEDENTYKAVVGDVLNDCDIAYKSNCVDEL